MQARAEAPCVHSTIDRDSERSQAAKSQVRELDASTRSHSRSSRDKRRPEKRPDHYIFQTSSGLPDRNENALCKKGGRGKRGYGLHYSETRT